MARTVRLLSGMWPQGQQQKSSVNLKLDTVSNGPRKANILSLPTIQATSMFSTAKHTTLLLQPKSPSTQTKLSTTESTVLVSTIMMLMSSRYMLDARIRSLDPTC